ncbi:SufE family protein [Calidifontibacter sp. DB0510]|uniref:SufE family protein n=1 Tax=Metallococcus carri TaxID=1656884 RepID=A0A967B7A6_9MICO|nr:SufE family protein [Metallococcus carri]NHN56051.1 SufE family protein [Metallococcus carri]NOP37492.1 cysteine desulfuration protein SufE [Calidifontibacter sp. DB2511S]
MTTAGWQELVAQFDGLDERARLQVLLEFGEDLAPVSPEPDWRRVTGCQVPVFLRTRALDGRVELRISVSPSAPVVRGYAGLLQAGVDGAVLGPPAYPPRDLPERLGLPRAVSPLRLRGLYALTEAVTDELRRLR